jgi:hypothetical protein
MPSDAGAVAKPYWCFVCVRLKRPIVYVDVDSRESVQATGYWMRLGISAPSRASLRNIVKQVVRDGFVQWTKSTLEPIKHNDADDVVESSANLKVNGVWYNGGRAYFVD